MLSWGGSWLRVESLSCFIGHRDRYLGSVILYGVGGGDNMGSLCIGRGSYGGAYL